MPQPTPYTRQFNFTNFSSIFPAKPNPGSQVDAEFNAVGETLDGVLANLELLQRDDGALRNEIVTYDSLNADMKSRLGQGGSPALGQILTSIAALSLADNVGKVLAVNGAADGFDLVAQAVGGGGGGGVQAVTNTAALEALTGVAEGDLAVVRLGAQRGSVWLAELKTSEPAAAIAADTLKGVYRPVSGSTTLIWKRAYNGPLNVTWFGAKGDEATASGPAFACAMRVAEGLSVVNSSIYRGGPPIYAPSGVYLMGATELLPRYTGILLGDGSGFQGGYATILRWDGTTRGITLPRYNTGPDRAIVAATFAADGYQLRGLRLEGLSSNSGNPNLHAIDAHCRYHEEDVFTYDWGGNGRNIVASAGAGAGGFEGNANCFSIKRGVSAFCLDGIYLLGADVNAGYVELFDASSNRGWGVNDRSFLGNTYVAPHTAGNGVLGGAGGPYRTENANSQTVFLGAYAEGGQNPSSFVITTLYLGGSAGSDVLGGCAWLNGTSASRIRPGGGVMSFESAVGDGVTNVAVVARASNGIGAFLAGDGGRLEGQAGYLFLKAAGSGVIRHQVENIGTIMEMDGGGLNFYSGKSVGLASGKVGLGAYTNASPSNGDVWYDGTAFRFRENGATKALGSGGSSAAAADPWTFVLASGTGSSQGITVQSGIPVKAFFVTVDGLVKRPTTDYTVSGNTLTITATAGVNNVMVRWQGYAPGDLGPNLWDNSAVTGTNGWSMNAGTGVATGTDAGTGLSGGALLTVGLQYQIDFDYTMTSGSALSLFDGSAQTLTGTLGSSGSATITHTAANTGASLVAANALFSGTVSNIRVRRKY